jgi:hypothetical protein
MTYMLEDGMEKINDIHESAKLVTTELPQSWIMWAYVEAYQTEGIEWRSATSDVKWGGN